MCCFSAALLVSPMPHCCLLPYLRFISSAHPAVPFIRDDKREMQFRGGSKENSPCGIWIKPSTDNTCGEFGPPVITIQVQGPCLNSAGDDGLVLHSSAPPSCCSGAWRTPAAPRQLPHVSGPVLSNKPGELSWCDTGSTRTHIPTLRPCVMLAEHLIPKAGDV